VFFRVLLFRLIVFAGSSYRDFLYFEGIGELLLYQIALTLALSLRGSLGPIAAFEEIIRVLWQQKPRN
jgi:hypothetical protein